MLGNLPSTEAAVVSGFLSAQKPRWMHASRLTIAANVHSDMTRWRPLGAPVHPPPGAISSGVFIWLVASRAWNLWDAWNCAYLRGSDEESNKNKQIV